MSNTLNNEVWETVGIAPLAAGWRNVYLDGGAHFAEACPAILLQELRAEGKYWDEQGPDGKRVRRQRIEKADPPYETRAVFADIECGHLMPACNTANYVMTIGPDDRMPEVPQ